MNQLIKILNWIVFGIVIFWVWVVTAQYLSAQTFGGLEDPFPEARNGWDIRYIRHRTAGEVVQYSLIFSDTTAAAANRDTFYVYVDRSTAEIIAKDHPSKCWSQVAFKMRINPCVIPETDHEIIFNLRGIFE